MSLNSNSTVFLCGIGGSGMRALVPLLLHHGCNVYGSDRGYDRGETPSKFSKLTVQGVQLFPQDGSGPETIKPDALIVSSAIENTVPDIQAARVLNIPIQKRAEILSGFLNTAKQSVAIGGTSGKSTVTGMIGTILYETGHSPTIVNGAEMVNFGGSTVIGKGSVFVAETDESDGSIALFEPSVAILTNITPDHKSMEELRALFGDFTSKASQNAVINLDDPEAAALSEKITSSLTYSLSHPSADIYISSFTLHPDRSDFTVHADEQSIQGKLNVPGRHNLSNALAALRTAQALGVSLKEAVQTLGTFKGIERRFQVVGTKNNITVIDDFGHNPDKIRATLRTLQETAAKGRTLAVFQPHGFGPLKDMRGALADMLVQILRKEDQFLLLPVYDAGGTADRTISSQDLETDLKAQDIQAKSFRNRSDLTSYLIKNAQPYDQIVIMGARDNTLPDFVAKMLSLL